MRFRQGALIEASIIYVVASLISFISLLIAFGFDFGTVIGAFISEAMILLLPSFFFWAIAGQLTKKRTAMVRFFVQVIISTLLAMLGMVLIKQLIDGATDPASKPYLNIFYMIFATYYLGAIAGSIVSNFWFVKRAQAAELVAVKNAKGGKK